MQYPRNNLYHLVYKIIISRPPDLNVAIKEMRRLIFQVKVFICRFFYQAKSVIKSPLFLQGPPFEMTSYVVLAVNEWLLFLRRTQILLKLLLRGNLICNDLI